MKRQVERIFNQKEEVDGKTKREPRANRKLEEKSDSKESKEEISKLMTKNEKMRKKTKVMKKEQEHLAIRLGEVMDEKGNAILLDIKPMKNSY